MGNRRSKSWHKKLPRLRVTSNTKSNRQPSQLKKPRLHFTLGRQENKSLKP